MTFQIPQSGTSKISTQSGWIRDEDDQVPVDVEADCTDAGEVRLAIDVSADWTKARPGLDAYLSPIDAVILGERLIAHGRTALEGLLEAADPDR